MGYTNKTSHYELPQYIASDKPSWLGDFNSAMLSIDTAIAGAAADAATASSQAGAAGTQVKNLNAQVTKIQSDMSGVTEIATNAQGAADAANTAAQQALTAANAAVPKSGAVMTGSLFLNADPTGSMQAATKQYVDAQAGAGGNALQKSGGTMTGPLYLSGAPTQDLQAATKKYVDDKTASGGIVTKLSLDITNNPTTPPRSYFSAWIQGKVLHMNGMISAAEEVPSGSTICHFSGNPLGLTEGVQTAVGWAWKTDSNTFIAVRATFNGTQTNIVLSASFQYAAFAFEYMGN